jgi:hypothetical protein
VGDNQWVSDWPPIDSPATVEALFEWLSRTYGVRRVYWRGEQDRMWLRNYLLRPENPLYFDFYRSWLRPLVEGVKTNDLAVAAARRRGMEIYVFDGLFEHGAQGDTGGCGMFPYQGEDRLRLEHPEWCPVDQWGERRCPGPIEFCYPEARAALVARYVKHVADYGYDGISFYTYVENLGLRYADEFGFNPPIVAEFKRRYGVDIRTQAFDKEAWHRLRGEYVTQFLRELHAALGGRGKKLSMTIRPDKPNLPQRWYGTGVDMPGAGMIHLDWETWVREGIVDEVFVWHGGGPEPLLGGLQKACAGKPIELVVFSSAPFAEQWKPFLEAGATPCTVAAPGYGIDPISLDPTSPATLHSPDWRLRAQTLTDIAAGKVKAGVGDVTSLASDPHVLVRRETMRTLKALKAAEATPVLEAALEDREPSVRIAAAGALGVVPGPDTPRRLLSAVLADSGFQFRQECVTALAAMKESAQPALIENLVSRSLPVREVCAQALGKNGLAGSQAPLLAALQRDRNDRVRFWAISGLAGYRVTAVFEALRGALDDPSPAVQLGAVRALGDMADAMAPEQSAPTLAALEALFRQYGNRCQRADAAWGWRAVGNAMLAFGDAGKARLETVRTEHQDARLAWLAYQVVYVPQSAQKVLLCEEKDAVETHARYAPPFPGRAVK